MAKDTNESTAPRRYSEEARAALKRHIERVNHQRGVSRDVDLDALLADLEITAKMYDRCVAPPQDTPKTTAGKTLDMLTECATAIRRLRGYLTNPALRGSWDFSSSDGLRRTIKAEPPPDLEPLIGELSKLQDKVEVDARELQEVVEGAKMHAFDADDCRDYLIKSVLDVGHQLFGPQVGHENGPLVTFLRLALEPVLGRATPSATALRTIARREGWSASRGNDAC